MARRIDINIGIAPNDYFELNVGKRDGSLFPLKLRPKQGITSTLPEIKLSLHYFFRKYSAFNIEIWPAEEFEKLCYIESGSSPNQFRIVVGSGMVITLQVLAAYIGPGDKVQTLVAEPYPVSIGAYGSRKIHWAAMIEGEAGLRELKYWIEEREEDPDAMDDFGTTPLLMAALAGAYENAKYLLKAGANPSHIDKKGATPFDNAEKSGNEQLMCLIAAAMFIA